MSKSNLKTCASYLNELSRAYYYDDKSYFDNICIRICIHEIMHSIKGTLAEVALIINNPTPN